MNSKLLNIKFTATDRISNVVTKISNHIDKFGRNSRVSLGLLGNKFEAINRLIGMKYKAIDKIYKKDDEEEVDRGYISNDEIDKISDEIPININKTVKFDIDDEITEKPEVKVIMLK